VKEKVIIKSFVSLPWLIILSVVFIPVFLFFIGILFSQNLNSTSEFLFFVMFFFALLALSSAIGFCARVYTVTDKYIRISILRVFCRRIAWINVKSVYYKKNHVIFSAIPLNGIKLSELTEKEVKHLSNPVSLPLTKKEIEKLEAYLKTTRPELL